MGDYGNDTSGVAWNVVPRTKQSYSPMPSFNTLATTALNSQPLGAFSAVDKGGNVENYVGTASKLYKMNNGTKPNFVDASGAAYTVPGGRLWSFAEADGFVYATNSSDKVQYRQIASAGAFANHPDTNCPTARFVSYIQPGFLLLGDINDPTAGIQPQGVRWSALGNAQSFPLIGSSAAIAANSDWQKIAGPHGRMMGICNDLSSCNAAVFFEQAIFKMVFTGTETIFAIDPIEQARGTPSPASIAQLGQIAYFRGWDGFYAFDGTEAIPIGNELINQYVNDDADPNYLNQTAATVDPTTGTIFWSYAGKGNSLGVPNRILVFNPYIGRFSLITQTAGNNLFLARTLGTSLDAIDALGFNLDTLPYSLDSTFLAGGNVVLGGFDSTFKYGSFTGPNMAFTVDTTEAQLVGGAKARVRGVRPIVEGDTCSVAVAGRNTTYAPVVFDTANAADQNGYCPARNESRYHRARLIGAAGNLCTHIKGAEFDLSQGGRR